MPEVRKVSWPPTTSLAMKGVAEDELFFDPDSLGHSFCSCLFFQFVQLIIAISTVFSREQLARIFHEYFSEAKNPG
jgi:hypothetical protein